MSTVPPLLSWVEYYSPRCTQTHWVQSNRCTQLKYLSTLSNQVWYWFWGGGELVPNVRLTSDDVRDDLTTKMVTCFSVGTHHRSPKWRTIKPRQSRICTYTWSLRMCINSTRDKRDVFVGPVCQVWPLLVWSYNFTVVMRKGLTVTKTDHQVRVFRNTRLGEVGYWDLHSRPDTTMKRRDDWNPSDPEDESERLTIWTGLEVHTSDRTRSIGSWSRYRWPPVSLNYRKRSVSTHTFPDPSIWWTMWWCSDTTGIWNPEVVVYVLGILRNRSFGFGTVTPNLNFEIKDKEHHTWEDQIGVKTEEDVRKSSC